MPSGRPRKVLPTDTLRWCQRRQDDTWHRRWMHSGKRRTRCLTCARRASRFYYHNNVKPRRA